MSAFTCARPPCPDPGRCAQLIGGCEPQPPEPSPTIELFPCPGPHEPAGLMLDADGLAALRALLDEAEEALARGGEAALSTSPVVFDAGGEGHRLSVLLVERFPVGQGRLSTYPDSGHGSGASIGTAVAMVGLNPEDVYGPAKGDDA